MTATDVLVRHDAIIDKLIGDEVMALFVRGFAGDEYRADAGRSAAIDLVHRRARRLPIGVAVNAGTAFVGNVGSGFVVDFTALGDAGERRAHLQGLAEDGEVLTEELYKSVRLDGDGLEPRVLQLRGRSGARTRLRIEGLSPVPPSAARRPCRIERHSAPRTPPGRPRCTPRASSAWPPLGHR